MFSCIEVETFEEFNIFMFSVSILLGYQGCPANGCIEKYNSNRFLIFRRWHVQTYIHTTQISQT